MPQHLAVQGDGLQIAVRGAQDGAAGGLVDAAGLHADKTVLHHVQAADAVGAAQCIEPGHQRHRSQALHRQWPPACPVRKSIST